MTKIDESKLILNLLSNIKFGYTNTLGSEKVDEIINNLMVILNDSIQEIERLRSNEKVLVDALETVVRHCASELDFGEKLNIEVAHKILTKALNEVKHEKE